MARALTDLRSLARSHTQMAIRVLAGIAQQKGAQASARVAACSALLDRGWGRPAQALTGADGEGDIKITIRKMLGGEDDDDPKAG